jgi:predicted RNA-binding Zn-ribbon protein involved in translation (DUF1610 family)
MQVCPICNNPVTPSERYQNYVCKDCAKLARSQDGRGLAFFNVSLSGGYAAQYTDTNEPYNSHDCYIHGIKCYADEHRFGGIVIVKVNNP